jgi:magnesium-transporting ATPase (P-type)
VVLLAALAAAIWWWPTDPGKAMMVAVAVLIVTCPCALSLATPVAMLTAAGTLARSGVLVRNLQGLEALAAVDTLVFDKTGTLTRDGLVLRALTPAEGQNTDELLALAALLARQSMHPASRPWRRRPRWPNCLPAHGCWIPSRKSLAAASMSGCRRAAIPPCAAIFVWARPRIAACPSWHRMSQGRA